MLDSTWASSRMLEPKYPFTAIVDQETVKIALILNAIDPTIGGVLISGPKGSGKSLIVRALSDVLPEIEHVADCPFHCSPNDPTNMCPSCTAKKKSGAELHVAKTPMRIVTVPLSVTDDMLVGSLDMDHAMREGVKALRPGLLAEANQNILYIDEVNLLPDHITDSILDAAASGWNIVEREGISVSHPSRFILVGTMNPEEGELRPQILDRFGVHSKTSNLEDPVLRTIVVQRNEEFIDNPSIFIKKNWNELEKLRRKIRKARELLSHVELHQEIFTAVASACSGLRVDGFRPDIAAMKVARALAAYEGREAVAMEDVAPSMELALGHRTRRSGVYPPPSKEQIQKALRKARRREYKLGISSSQLMRFIQLPKEVIRTMMRSSLKNLVARILLIALMAIPLTLFLETFRSTYSPLPSTRFTLFINGIIGGILSLLLASLLLRSRRRKEKTIRFLDLSKITLNTESQFSQFDKPTGTGTGAGSAKVRYGKGFATTPEHGPKILKPMDSLHRKPSGTKLERIDRHRRGGGYNFGTRRKTISTLTRGRSAWHQLPRGRSRDIALVPTLRAAALYQKYRREEASSRIIIRPEDIRVRVREYRPPYSTLLLVDMSMSMINSIDNLIHAIYSLHGREYRRRDRVGLIVFKGSKAFTIQHPTMNLDLVVRKLKEVGASDFTPMAAGLLQALKVLKQEKMRNRDAVLNLIIFSDGIVNVPLESPLSPLTRRRYYSEAQADSIDIARLLSKEKFRVHIINTKHVKEDVETAPTDRMEGWRRDLRPTQFLMELAQTSGGNYYGLSLEMEGEEDLGRVGWFYSQYSR